MNSWQIPFTHTVCSISPSDGILIPTYPKNFFFPFFFAIHLWYCGTCHWHWPWVETEKSQNWCFLGI